MNDAEVFGCERVIFPVFIELPTSDAPPSAAAALINACRASAAGRSCELSVSARSAESDVVASVDFVDAEQRLATIRIGLGQLPGRTWQTRRMEFRPADDTVERWRSVGLVIGTLAADYTQQRPERPVEAATPVRETPPPFTGARGRSLSIDAGLVGGIALNGAPWSGGPHARASLFPWRAPVAITLALRYEKDLEGGQDFDLEVGSGSVGAAGRWLLGPIGLQPRLELLRQLIVLSAKDAATGAVQSRGRWHTGARAGLDADIHLTGGFFVVGGVDATWVDAPTAIEVRNVSEGELPSLAVTANVGLRWSSGVGW